MEHFKPPGRLGDPTMSLETEPRTHPQLLKAINEVDGILSPSFLSPDLTHESPLEALCDFVTSFENAIEGLLDGFDYEFPMPTEMASKQITQSEESIIGPDGNMIKLIIRRPSHHQGTPLPAIIYFHGGGMVILQTENRMHASWAESLARTGLVVISVDFRNALGPSGYNPFPAGLNDCAFAVRWISEHKQQLGISTIVLQGESGGANLAIATALKAKKEGWSTSIDGVFASVPYISGAYSASREWKLKELPSLVECDGYTVSIALAALNAKVYTPTEEHSKDPLAWPYWASETELVGLPPHFIVTSELDPYRDEGHVYHQKLARAGVDVLGKMTLGMVHEAELEFRKTLPGHFLALLWDCRKFVDHVQTDKT